MDRRCRRGVSMTLLEILPSLRQASPRIDRAIWPLSAHVDELGRLCVGEVPLTEVANQFGTPTYAIDEADGRSISTSRQQVSRSGAFGKQVRLEPGITYSKTPGYWEVPGHPTIVPSGASQAGWLPY